MANYAFNVGKGRICELANRVLTNDPTDSAFIAIPMATSGSEAQGQDLATFAAVEADDNFSEQAAASWGRKTIDASGEGLSYTVDNTDNEGVVDISDLVWAAPLAGNNTTGLIICYDPDTTGGDDTNLVPLVHLDMAVTADGNQVTYQVNAEGLLNAN